MAGTGPLYKTWRRPRPVPVRGRAARPGTRCSPARTPTTGAVDVAIDPRDSKIVYAAMWDNFRERDRRAYEGVGSGLYKSTDGGKTWARIGTPFFGPRPDLGRIGVAVAPDGTLYANASGASGVYNGFFRSTDGGTTWSAPASRRANPQDSFYVYGWWFGRIYVDPKDSKHVFQAALVLQESKNGGQSWANAPGSCGNICAAATPTSTAWPGTRRSPAACTSATTAASSAPTTTARTAAGWTGSSTCRSARSTDSTSPSRTRRGMVVGLQDNGGNRTGGSTDAGSAARRSVDRLHRRRRPAGDGSRRTARTCSTGATSTATASCRPTAARPAPILQPGDLGRRKNWFTPIEFDPEDSHTIYTGGEIINRSDRRCETFTPISPPLSNGPGRETNPLFHNYGTLTTIAPAGKSTGTIYAGTDDGNLWSTHDNGTHVDQGQRPRPAQGLDHARGGRHQAPEHGVCELLGLPPGRQRGLRPRDHRRRRRTGTTSARTCPRRRSTTSTSSATWSSSPATSACSSIRRAERAGCGWARACRCLRSTSCGTSPRRRPTRSRPCSPGTFGRGAYKIDPSVIQTTK